MVLEINLCTLIHTHTHTHIHFIYPILINSFTFFILQLQDIVFMGSGREFFSCNDLVTRDSADRNIMAWDFSNGVVLSNQIYQVIGLISYNGNQLLSLKFNSFCLLIFNIVMKTKSDLKNLYFEGAFHVLSTDCTS